MVVPDSIEPYIGWKALRISDQGLLYSPQSGCDWPKRSRLEAICYRERLPCWRWIQVETSEAYGSEAKATVANVPIGLLPPLPREDPMPGYTWVPMKVKDDHKIVDAICSCGIYAVSNPHDCWAYLRSEDGVLVEVAVWGRTVIASDGVRGQYAYPQKIVVSSQLEELGQKAAEAYGVPCVVDDELIHHVPLMTLAPLPRKERKRSTLPLLIALTWASIAVIADTGGITLAITNIFLIVAAMLYLFTE